MFTRRLFWRLIFISPKGLVVSKTPKRPRDTNQLAKLMTDILTGQVVEGEAEPTDAQKFARGGGLKGGPARARKLSVERRAEIAKKAAEARWKK